ncbi:SET domain-containing protein [Flavobacterium amnicola]|uniref:SET domain-containing protein n=1 Tax=Flavobacterium amnicola TaxID=2506422 RepID=A0A4Q1K3H6_9FLAO|nr:SET domain-containing protein-lysine N-methyltransferase [Flavobacterium amnicola]RXR19287.1 SET domain-containing protein [Flavobacterium amnicola]
MPIQDKNTIEALEDDYLYIQPSQITNSGNGLFTAIKIYKDEIIAVFKGEILSPTEIIKREVKGEDKYFMVLLDGSVLDCMLTDCFAKYANDASGLGKSSFVNNAKITLDDNGNVCLVATSTIKEHQEIFCSYGQKYWKKHK